MVINMIIYSHRGENKFAPENTLYSFYLCEYFNDDGIEFDIRKTKDNVIVIIHDATINRTTNKVGFVRDYTFDKLSNINFGSKEKYEPILSLDEFLRFFSNKNILLYIEIKEDGYEEDILNIINRYLTKNIILISFNYNILKKIRRVDDKIAIGWLVFDYNEIIKKKASQIFVSEIICPSIMLNKNKIERIKKDHFGLCAWAIASLHELKDLEKIGVEKAIFESGKIAKEYLNQE